MSNFYALARNLANPQLTYRKFRYYRDQGYLNEASPQDFAALVLLGLQPALAKTPAEALTRGHYYSTTVNVGGVEYSMQIKRTDPTDIGTEPGYVD